LEDSAIKISLFRKTMTTPAVNIQPLIFLITVCTASRLLTVISVPLLRKRHTAEIAISTTSWHTPYRRRLTGNQFSLSVLKGWSRGTNNTLAVLFWRTSGFQKHYLLRFCILLTGATSYPLVFSLLRPLGVLHKYLTESVTARAETNQPW
jgi:hypothetical protein